MRTCRGRRLPAVTEVCGFPAMWEDSVLRSKTIRSLDSFILMTILAAAPAHTAIVETYTSAQALENASQSPERITFEEVAEGPYTQSSPLTVGTSFGPVIFTAWWTETGSSNFSVPSNPNPSWTGRHVQGPPTNVGNSHLRVWLPGTGNILFVGANLMLQNAAVGSVRVRALDNLGIWHQHDLTTLSTTGQTNGYANAAFIGFRFDRPILEWRMYSLDPASRILFDNLYLAQRAAAPPDPPPPAQEPVPDAATHLLCGGGILLIAARRWWKKRSQARRVVAVG